MTGEKMSKPCSRAVVFAVLASTLYLPPAYAKDGTAGGSDGGGKLAPFKWDKKAEIVNGGGQKNEEVGRTDPVPRQDDELVCDKNVYPVAAPKDMKQEAVETLGNVRMGTRRCWRKSNPSNIIEKPFSMMDPMADAIKGMVGTMKPKNSVFDARTRELLKKNSGKDKTGKGGKGQKDEEKTSSEKKSSEKAPAPMFNGDTPMLLRD